MSDVVSVCRDLLETVTPLPSDCGHLCGCACCSSLQGETTGMLLFPGEETFYAALPGYRIQSAGEDKLLLCSGRCSRSDRPLSCRLFPLLPLIRPEGIKAAMDARAIAVCPLYRMGPRGLSTEFRQAVRRCGELLAADDTQRAFLLRLTRNQDDLKSLQQSFSVR